jgi:hypothetical protein
MPQSNSALAAAKRTWPNCACLQSGALEGRLLDREQVRVLCPARHCVIAVADECDTRKQAEGLRGKLQARFDQLCESKVLNRRCDLCGSTAFHIEVGRTRFKTLEEATPFLRAGEAAQQATAAEIKARKN